MFWDPPKGYVPGRVEMDMKTRLGPSDLQREIAAAMLAAAPERITHVCVPIALPDKDHGVWTLGQVVEHPPGFWLADNGTDWEVPLHLSKARDLAEAAAETFLGDRPGQPAWASIDRRGLWAVFEGFRHGKELA